MRSGTDTGRLQYFRPIRVQGCRGRRHVASACSCRFVPAVWRPVRYCSFSGIASKREAMPFFWGCRQCLRAESMTRRHSSRPKLPKEEGFTWSGCNPVGVTAPCVQHGTGGFLQTFICHVDQTVLQSKGTDISIFFSKSFVFI